MFRQALSEVRRHPGRFISTLLAIAISVAFLAGSATLVATEQQAKGKAANVPIAMADLVVVVPRHTEVPGIGAVLGSQPGIETYAAALHASTVVSNGALSQSLDLVGVPPEALRWANLVSGHWPQAPDQIALSKGGASALGASLGKTLKIAGSDQQLVVVGLTDEPSGMFSKVAYASDALLDPDGKGADQASSWAIKLAPQANAATVIAELTPKLAALNPQLTVKPGQVVRDDAVARIAGDFEVFSNVLWAFAAVSLVVGMITIANTFTITLAQRRRQIGLLRAVGASGAQVRGRFLAEAAVLGVVGSVLGLAFGIGLAAGVTAWSTALFWGLALPVWQLSIAVGLGVLATLIAAFVPIVRGTQVLPLEALQPVQAADEARRTSLVRVIICGLLVVAGAAGAVFSLVAGGSNALLFAIGAGALIAAGVLFGGPLFVPALLKISGLLVRSFGTVSRLAADNAERNPRRATATATALMLAIGLMVTLQVATASLRATVLDELATKYPVDLQVSWTNTEGTPGSIPAASAAKLAAMPGVDATVLLPAGTAAIDGQKVTVLGYQPGIVAATGVTAPVTDNQVLVSPELASDLPRQVTLVGKAGRVELSVVSSRLVDYRQALVSTATLSQVSTVTPQAVMWLSVPDRGQAVSLMVAASDIAGSQDRLGGTLAMAALYEQVLNVLLAITTGLLAVAVLIALIGVSNTLSLSVLERTRESALLRALGLQARSLRVMLTVEALQVTVVGVIVGVVFGAGFGWLAVATTAKSGGMDQVVFAVDVPQTLGMIAIAMAAAAMASVLPGRRAAKAAPTEALADL